MASLLSFAKKAASTVYHGVSPFDHGQGWTSQAPQRRLTPQQVALLQQAQRRSNIPMGQAQARLVNAPVQQPQIQAKPLVLPTLQTAQPVAQPQLQVHVALPQGLQTGNKVIQPSPQAHTSLPPATIAKLQNQIAQAKQHLIPTNPIGAAAQQFIGQPAAEIAATVLNKPLANNKVGRVITGQNVTKPIQQDVKGVYRAVKAGGQTLPGNIPIPKSLAPEYAAAAAVLHIANDVPLAGAAAKAGVKGFKTLDKAAIKSAQLNPAAQIGAVGKDVRKVAQPKLPIKMNSDAQQKVFEANPLKPKITSSTKEPVDNNLLTTMDKIIAQSTGSTPQDAARIRIRGQRNADAELAALNHLQAGGSRDEAVKTYQQVAHVTQKQAQFNVARAAKQANQALNVSKRSPNPLLGKFHLPEAKVGDYLRAPHNQATVTNNINQAAAQAEKAFNPLSARDRANIPHYTEGTLNVSKAENPQAVKAAVSASQNLTDTIHALDAPHGNTPHIQNFFPRYYADITDQPAKAQMAAEEAALANRPVPLEDTGNYAGFHNKQRVFATRKEAQDAGFQFKYPDPLQDLKHYATGAKLNIGNQAFIKAVREAQGAKDPLVPFEGGQKYSIDLSGDSGVKVDKKGAKALKNYGVQKPIGPVKKALRGVNTSIIKTIVANPIFHGGNQEFNAVFQGAFRMPGNKAKNVLNLIRNHANISEADRTNFYREGNFSPSYGKDRYGFIAKGLEKAGVNPGKAEISPRAMAAIEENIRVSLWKIGKERGLRPAQNTKAINKVLGGQDILGDMSSSVGLFLHYFTTNVKLLGSVAKETSKGNVAPLTGLAIGTAAWGAATKGFQDATGNKTASVRAPGVLGVGLQLAKVPGQLKKGRIPSVITNHINPLITLAASQATNRDLKRAVIGKKAQYNTLDGKYGSGRLKSATSTTIGPAGTAQDVASGRTSPVNAGLALGLGLYNNKPFPKSSASTATNSPTGKKLTTRQLKATNPDELVRWQGMTARARKNVQTSNPDKFIRDTSLKVQQETAQGNTTQAFKDQRTISKTQVYKGYDKNLVGAYGLNATDFKAYVKQATPEQVAQLQNLDAQLVNSGLAGTSKFTKSLYKATGVESKVASTSTKSSGRGLARGRTSRSGGSKVARTPKAPKVKLITTGLKTASAGKVSSPKGVKVKKLSNSPLKTRKLAVSKIPRIA